MEMHRQQRHDRALVERKAREALVADREALGLARALGEGHGIAQVVAAGIAGSCHACGSLLGTDDRYCSRCGTPAPGVRNGAPRPVPAATVAAPPPDPSALTHAPPPSLGARVDAPPPGSAERVGERVLPPPAPGARIDAPPPDPGARPAAPPQPLPDRPRVGERVLPPPDPATREPGAAGDPTTPIGTPRP
jgi:formin 2